MNRALPRWWLRDSWPSRALIPLAWAYGAAAGARRHIYRRGWRASHRPPVPVLVIGNIFVGGTGKTPLVLEAVRRLRALGRSPAILTRGYGGSAGRGPLRVTSETDWQRAGDEPVLLARVSGVPVYVGSRRALGAQLAVAEGADVLVTDDGLQHYALQRDREIAVLDGVRRLGNGRLLPAGPLREPVERLDQVDAVAVNTHPGASNGPRHRELAFQLTPEPPRLLGAAPPGAPEASSMETLPPDSQVHAVAGIGHPERFFQTLERLELRVTRHAFPDHHAFAESDLTFPDDRPVVLTGKDAVRCEAFAEGLPLWWVPVRLEFLGDGAGRFQKLLEELVEAGAPRSTKVP